MPDVRLQEATDRVRIPLYDSQKAPRYTFGKNYGDQLYINCYPEIARNTATGEGEISIQRRSGFTKKLRLSTHFSGSSSNVPLANITIGTLDDVNVCAIWDDTGTAIRIIQYRPDAATSTLIGSISSANTTGAVSPTNQDEVFLTECELVNAGTIYPGVAISWRKYNSTYSDGFWARSSSGVFSAASLTKITAASFPVTLGKIITGPFQQMNGVFYIMGTNGNIYNSGGASGTVNDLTQWDALGVIKAQQSIDAGVGVFRYKHHLLAFGRSSVEFFNDEGNAVPASPLGVTEQALVKFGAYSAKHVVNIEDSVYFVGAGNDATTGVYKLDGYTTTALSSLPIDMTTVDTHYAQDKMSLNVILVNGRQHLLLSGLALANEIFQDAPYDSNNNDDTTSTDASDISTNEGSIYCWAYNLRDNTSWWAIVNAGGGLYNVLPALQTTYNYPARKQYHLLYDTSGTMDGTTVYQWSYEVADMGPGTYYDGNGASSETTAAFVSAIRTNKYSMNSTHRKRILRAAIEMNTYPWDTVSGNESIYLGIFRGVYSGGYPEYAWRRRILKSNSSTQPPSFIWQNLGQGRQFQFIIAYKGRSDFSPNALELVVAQGSK